MESGNENVLFVCMCIPFPVFKDGQLENTEGLTLACCRMTSVACMLEGLPDRLHVQLHKETEMAEQ